MTRLKILRRLPERLRGLLFTKPTDDVVLLVPCCDIHTFGMGYALDVAFLDCRGMVISAYRSVEPRSRLRCSRACAVIERAASPAKQWFVSGAFAGTQIKKALKGKEDQ